MGGKKAEMNGLEWILDDFMGMTFYEICAYKPIDICIRRKKDKHCLCQLASKERKLDRNNFISAYWFEIDIYQIAKVTKYIF